MEEKPHRRCSEDTNSEVVSNKITNHTGPTTYHGENAYNYLNTRLKEKAWHKEQEIMVELLSEIQDNSTVLDVPFGTGRYVNLYLKKNMSIYGLDISIDMLNEAKNILGNSYNQCNVSIGSADYLPYDDESFDLVVCSRFFQHLTLDMALRTLIELKRVAKSKIYLNMRTKKGFFSALDVDQKLSRKICEKDLINIFNTFGLKVLKKRIIEVKKSNVATFYVLEKSAYLSRISLLKRGLWYLSEGCVIKLYQKISKEISKASKLLKKNYLKIIRKLNIQYTNLKNIILHGKSAPRVGEIIWVDPRKVKKGVPKEYLINVMGKQLSHLSGLVIKSHWPGKEVFQINEVHEDDRFSHDGIGIKLKICIEHWVNGYSWEETGILEFMAEKNKNGRINIHRSIDSDAIQQRYHNLDKIFLQVRKEGRLRLNSEVNKKYFYSWGPAEAMIHIGPNGELFWGGGACHRFAIAYILDIPFPARIGLVHKSAISLLYKFRKK